MTRFCLHLTDEKMIEIGRVRESLMDYKRKIQPHDLPPVPEAPLELPDVNVIVKHHYINSQWSKDKAQHKPSGYKGIK